MVAIKDTESTHSNNVSRDDRGKPGVPNRGGVVPLSILKTAYDTFFTFTRNYFLLIIHGDVTRPMSKGLPRIGNFKT